MCLVLEKGIKIIDAIRAQFPKKRNLISANGNMTCQPGQKRLQ